MYESYDDYYEMMEIEEEFYNLKNSLMKTIKEEHLTKMKKLEEENEQLQDVKRDFDKIKREYQNKLNELEREKDEFKIKVRKNRISELLEDTKTVMYRVKTNYTKAEKCDKCNENRKIYYTTPLGRETYEYCTCNDQIKSYEAEPMLLYVLNDSTTLSGLYYVKHKGTYKDTLELLDDDDLNELHRVIKSEDDFKHVGEYFGGTYFKTKELCESFIETLSIK